MIRKKASAIWKGGLKDGGGTVSTESGVLQDSAYGFNTRFEGKKGTNPEELIGAAHAACFSMALSLQLEQSGLKADSIETSATVTLEQSDAGFTITAVHLDVTGRMPGGDEQAFLKAANEAKAGCPVSKVLNADITMQARLAT